MSNFLTCTVCAAAFAKKRHTTGKYCSRRCAWVARGGAAFNAKIARASAEARGDAQRGRGIGATYTKRGGVHEHRRVAAQMLGRALLPKEIVHHIDGNLKNNEPSNLLVMTQADHMREHGLGIPGLKPPGEPWKYRWPK